jgi:uncharacterized membrane protein YeaQ/YmgE (transglycosylase-associated protein family)
MWHEGELIGVSHRKLREIRQSQVLGLLINQNDGERGVKAMLGTILGAVITGVILGYLAKLILPGRQEIPAWATIGAGIVAALIGGLIADWLGIGVTRGIDWWKHIIQIVLAVIAVSLVARMFASRGPRGTTGSGRSAA